MSAERLVHKCFCSFLHKSPKLETARTSVNRRIDKSITIDPRTTKYCLGMERSGHLVHMTVGTNLRNVRRVEDTRHMSLPCPCRTTLSM